MGVRQQETTAPDLASGSWRVHLEKPRFANEKRIESLATEEKCGQYRTVYYESYGCTANRSDTEIMLAILGRSGYREVSDPRAASVLLINTCAVKKTTEDRMLERLSRLGSYRKPIMIAGCLPRIDLSGINAVIPQYSVILDPCSVNKVHEAAEESLQGNRRVVKFTELPRDKTTLPRRRLNHYIGIVPISEGCLVACAYCCTRFSRGRLFCYSPKGILNQVRKSVAEGAVEIQITAQDTASYHVDGLGLADTLRDVVNVEGDFKVQVGMMNPDQTRKIMEDLVEVYQDPKIYKFLHLPVQSGSDTILESMNRR